MTLLASASSIDRIEKMIREFWHSDLWVVNRETLAIEHPTKDVEGVRIVKLKNRYRFEMCD